MSDNNLVGYPDEPEINLDEWIMERLPIEDAKKFYAECKGLEANYCRGRQEVWFVFALQDAAHGLNANLSSFLSSDSRFETLTKPKRELLAWVMRNPQKVRKTSRNTIARLKNLAHVAAYLEGQCGYNKTAAVDGAVQSYIEAACLRGDKLKDPDLMESKFSSLRAQLFKEIRVGGKLHDYYHSTLEEIGRYNREWETLREVRDGASNFS